MNISFKGYLRCVFIITYVLICAYLVGVKDYNVWKDYYVYWNYFVNAQANSISNIFYNIQDPFFVLTIKPFTMQRDGFQNFLLLCAIITLSLKFYAISKETRNIYLFTLLYSSYLLCLHEYIQIRIALSLAIFCIGAYTTNNRSFLRASIFFIAILFHLSVIVPIIIFYSVKSRLIGFKKFFMFSPIILIIPTLIFSGVLNINRVNNYLLLQSQGVGDQTNIFSTLPFLQLCCLVFIYFNKKTKEFVYTYEYAMSFCGVAIFYSMLSIPVLALRYFEICNLFFLILLSKIYRKSFFFFACILVYLVIGIKNYGQLLGLHIPFLT